MRIPLSSIRTDGGTQPRSVIDFDVVDDYTEAMAAGAKFPAIVVFYDGSEYWLADGFHRYRAALGAELEEIECDVHQGTVEDAQWYSFSANRSHGLRRTNEDKQRSVKAALTHPKSMGLSDNQIAKHVGVAQSTVSDWRRKIAPALNDSLSGRQTRSCSDGRTMNVTNIGKRPAADPAPRPAPAPPPPPAPTQQPFAAPPPPPEPSAEEEALSFMRDALRVLVALPAAPSVLGAFLSSHPDRERILSEIHDATEYLNRVSTESKRRAA